MNKVFQTQLFKNDKVELVRTRFTGESKELLKTHYSGSKEIVGRRLFYNIFYKGKKVGIIGVQAVSMPIKAVSNYVYGDIKLSKDNVKIYFNEIVNNNVFRLEFNEQNLATRILKEFRKKVKLDFFKEYNVKLKAIISLSYGINSKGIERNGFCYKADNWKYLGLTQGARKITSTKGKVIDKKLGKETKIIKDGIKKHIYCYKYEKEKK